jgi:predicted nucleic-acid-binding Zn-ribbon protein
MGRVRMTEYSCEPDIQQSFAYVYDYVYCDKCGSFNIKMSSKIPELISQSLFVLTLISIGAGVVIFAINVKLWQISCLFDALGFISFVIVGVSGKYYCKKCGNDHITSNNVLKYSSKDTSIVDIPLKTVIKYQIKSYNVEN